MDTLKGALRLPGVMLWMLVGPLTFFLSVRRNLAGQRVRPSEAARQPDARRGDVADHLGAVGHRSLAWRTNAARSHLSLGPSPKRVLVPFDRSSYVVCQWADLASALLLEGVNRLGKASAR
jgi:hypothetical protein